MATHDYNIANGTGAAVRADINNVLLAIQSTNANSSPPSTTVAFQLWADTSSGTLKIRNAANSAFIELMQLDGTMTMEDGSSSTPGLAFRDDLNTGIFSSGADTFDIATGGVGRFQIDSSEITFNETGADTDFRVEGDSSTHLLFIDAGNDRVGIKAASPQTPLHVGGTIHTTSNIGIRVTSPSNNLHVHQDDSDKSIAQFTNTSTGTGAGDGFQIGISSDENGLVNMKETKAINFKTADITRMTLDSSGKLFLGTTDATGIGSPDTNMIIGATGNNEEVALTLNVIEGTNNRRVKFFLDDDDGVFGVDTTASTGVAPFVVRIGTSERMRVDTSGNLCIGETGEPAAGSDGIRFEANGTTKLSTTGTGERNIFEFKNANGNVGKIVTQNSNTTYSTSSDYRLKENVVAISDGITRLKQLKPSRFNFIVKKDLTQDGFLAHEVQSVVPEAISGEKDAVKEDGSIDPQGIDQGRLVPLLVAAVKELITKVEALEAA
tara:strand:- start:104 stop:1585 length:1482 start_codon:yes stop_codon:yes gene_type:complete